MTIPAEGSRRVLRAFKTELDLNNTQRTKCAQHAGAARYAYNWGLARKLAAYTCPSPGAGQAQAKTPTAIDLHKKLNCLKKPELTWLHASTKCGPQKHLRTLRRAVYR